MLCPQHFRVCWPFCSRFASSSERPGGKGLPYQIDCNIIYIYIIIWYHMQVLHKLKFLYQELHSELRHYASNIFKLDAVWNPASISSPSNSFILLSSASGARSWEPVARGSRQVGPLGPLSFPIFPRMPRSGDRRPRRPRGHPLPWLPSLPRPPGQAILAAIYMRSKHEIPSDLLQVPPNFH